LLLLAGLGWGIVELVSWGTAIGVRLLHALGIVLFGLAVTGLLVGGVAPTAPGKRRSWFLAALGSAILGALCTSGASIAQDQITKRLAGTDCFAVYVEAAQLASAIGQPATLNTLEHDGRRGGCAQQLRALIKEEHQPPTAKVECVALLAQMDELLDDEPKSVAENAARKDPRAASCEVPIEQLARR
jgi:hypothetical protein